MGGILVTFHDLCVLPHSFGTEAMGRRSEVMVCYTEFQKSSSYGAQTWNQATLVVKKGEPARGERLEWSWDQM